MRTICPFCYTRLQTRSWASQSRAARTTTTEARCPCCKRFANQYHEITPLRKAVAS